MIHHHRHRQDFHPSGVDDDKDDDGDDEDDDDDGDDGDGDDDKDEDQQLSLESGQVRDRPESFSRSSYSLT